MLGFSPPYWWRSCLAPQGHLNSQTLKRCCHLLLLPASLLLLPPPLWMDPLHLSCLWTKIWSALDPWTRWHLDSGRCVHHLPHQLRPRILATRILSPDARGSLPPSGAAARNSTLSETIPSMTWSVTAKSWNLPHYRSHFPGVETSPLPISGTGTSSFFPITHLPSLGLKYPLFFCHHPISRVAKYPEISGAGTHSEKSRVAPTHLGLHPDPPHSRCRVTGVGGWDRGGPVRRS